MIKPNIFFVFCLVLYGSFFASFVNAQTNGRLLPPVISFLLEDEKEQARVDTVFLAQTHVQRTTETYAYGLVSDREALIKAHVVSPGKLIAPLVEAILTLDGNTMVLNMSGPSILPTVISKTPGRVQHSFADSFTAYIPKAWVKPGLSMSVRTPEETYTVQSLRVGAPTKVLMSMFDVSFFAATAGDYTAGWERELAAKLPVAEFDVQRIPNVVFPTLVIPFRGAGLPAIRVSSQQEYLDRTGQRFDGEQGAAAQWNGALKRAAGTAGRVRLYYVNIYGVPSGGQAGGFAGVGNGTSVGILNHELGHAFSLPHWGNNRNYPYKGDMFGIKAPNVFNATHAGPIWAFDLPSRTFIPPTVQSNTVGKGDRAVVGTFKADPMQGGGTGDQERGFILRHFSDFSVRQMRDFFESHVVTWNATLDRWANWDQTKASYSKVRENNGVLYPLQRNASVISVMAALSSVRPDNISMVYPPIGPYTAGMIRRFDPSVTADRSRADDVFCPATGCDATLRVTQGGVVNDYMIDASVIAGVSAESSEAFITRAVNLPAAQGGVTKIELLETPDVEQNGLPSNPLILASWSSN